jgi:chaperonin GroES
MNDMAYTGGGEPKRGKSVATKLLSFIDQINLVPELEPEMVRKIGLEVVRGYDQDKGSRAEWEKMMEKAMELAMQVHKDKSWPWPKAANVKYPLLTTAAIQFSARAYPAIVQGEQVVKGMFLGPDENDKKADRAMRIGQHMSYQLLQQIDGWDEDTDRLLLQMSIVGCAFRKTYFDPAEGQPCSELVPAKYVVYDHCTPWRDLKRISQYMLLTRNDVIERVRGELFEDVKLTQPMGESDDPESPFEFIEQHCWYDLDGDGYKEPYVVTVVKETSEVARIVARFDEDGIKINGRGEVAKITPVSYWTKYPFMPNPDGGSYDVGLGILLNSLNESVNTVLNQMLDAGTLANTGGGFIGRGLNLKGGAARFTPGEFKPVDMGGGKIAAWPADRGRQGHFQRQGHYAGRPAGEPDGHHHPGADRAGAKGLQRHLQACAPLPGRRVPEAVPPESPVPGAAGLFPLPGQDAADLPGRLPGRWHRCCTGQ